MQLTFGRPQLYGGEHPVMNLKSGDDLDIDQCNKKRNTASGQ